MIYTNKVILQGSVGADPDVRTFENGGSVANFRMATTESYKDKDGAWQNKTEWHTISAKWKSLVEFVQNHVTKGDVVKVEGKLSTRSWGDDDNKKYVTEVVASNIEIDWSHKKKNNDGNDSIPVESDVPVKQEVKVEQPGEEDDDLPF